MDEIEDLKTAICSYLKGVEPSPWISATLIQDGQVVSTGEAMLGTPETFGTFVPENLKPLDTPDRATTLKLRDRAIAIHLSNLEWCPRLHYHFVIVQSLS